MNLNNWEWSPTLISFNADSSQTALSTSWHLYNVRLALPLTSRDERGIYIYIYI